MERICSWISKFPKPVASNAVPEASVKDPLAALLEKLEELEGPINSYREIEEEVTSGADSGSA
jgi:hypothetical protein